MSSPTDNQKLLVDAFNTIRKLINNWPEEWLHELFAKHTGVKFDPDFVAADILGQLSILEQMAALGSQDAVEDLAAIATWIALFLDHLAGHRSDSVQQNVDQDKLTHRAIDAQMTDWTGIRPNEPAKLFFCSMS